MFFSRTSGPCETPVNPVQLIWVAVGVDVKVGSGVSTGVEVAVGVLVSTGVNLPMLIEVGSGIEPFGARAVGEPPMIPTLAAVANAIHSATGVRLKELPMTPEAVLKTIQAE